MRRNGNIGSTGASDLASTGSDIAAGGQHFRGLRIS